MAIVRLRKMECVRCGHAWLPRKEDVRICPRCKTAYFDTPKERTGDEKENHPDGVKKSCDCQG